MRVKAGATPEFNAGLRSEDAEEAVLSACFSFKLAAVVYPDGYQHGVVQFCHFSVKGFLTSSRLATSPAVSRYHVLLELAKKMLAQACLSILLEYGNHVTNFASLTFLSWTTPLNTGLTTLNLGTYRIGGNSGRDGTTL